jgi:hypothetical protein
MNAGLEKAKWYYYAYSIEQNGYSGSGEKLNQVSCEIKLNRVDQITSDTVNFYFSLFYHDSSNVCYLKPLEIVGIKQIKETYYIPIYHSVEFEAASDTTMSKMMQLQSSRLKQKIYLDTSNVNNWLLSAAGNK